MSKDDLIRIRSEKNLKDRLKVIAKRKRTDVSEFVRQRLWELVEAEEKRFAAEQSQATADPVREVLDDETRRRAGRGPIKEKRKEA